MSFGILLKVCRNVTEMKMRTSREIQTLDFGLNLTCNCEPKCIFESERHIMNVGFRKEHLKSIYRQLLDSARSGIIFRLKALKGAAAASKAEWDGFDWRMNWI